MKPNHQPAAKAPPATAYLRTKVLTATPAELRLMLFDGAIRFAEQGRQGIAERNFELAYTGISRCQSILMELINALRPEQDPDLCQKLSALYTFMYTRLVTASSEKSSTIMDEVLKLLRFERETWQMLLDQLTRENASSAGMGETPSAKPQAAAKRGNERSLVSGSVSLQG